MELAVEHLHPNTELSESADSDNSNSQEVYKHIPQEFVTRIFNLVELKNLAELQAALSDVPRVQLDWLFRAYNEQGLGLLHLAISLQDLPMVEYFLQQGADMSRRTHLDEQSDAIELAVQLENEALIDLLLSYHEYPDNLKSHLAVAIKYHRVYADCLLKYLRNPAVPQEFRNAIVAKVEAVENDREIVYGPLDEAVRTTDVELVRQLLAIPEIEAAINAKGKGGGTALHWAVNVGQQEIFNLLLENGADPFVASDHADDTVLHYACKKADIASVNVLLNRYPDAHGFFATEYNSTPYWHAVLAERKDDPSPDIVPLQERLLAFIHDSNSIVHLNDFVDNLFTATLNRIIKIPDDNLRQSMCNMYDVLKKDYVKEIIPVDPAQRSNIIAQNNKVLCLTQLLGSTADRILSGAESKEVIANDFKKFSAAKLYNERSKRLALQIVGGILGAIVFGIGGFIAGAALTAGPGAPVFAGIAAVEGAAIGAAAACAAGAAAAGGVGGVMIASSFVKTMKMQFRIWQVNQACSKHIRSAVVPIPEDQESLLRSENSAELR